MATTRDRTERNDGLRDTRSRGSTPRIDALVARVHRPVGTGPGTPRHHDWQEPGAEAWFATTGQDRFLRVAAVEAETWRRTAPVIDDLHLILGEPRPPRVVSTFYTCGMSVDGGLAEHLRSLPECAPEYAAFLKRVVEEMGPETMWGALGWELAARGLVQSTQLYWGAQYQGHMVLDWPRLLREGLGKLGEFAERWAAEHPTEHGRTLAAATLTCLRGLQDYLRAHAEAAAEAARAGEFTDARRAELRRAAETCEHIVSEAPRTFREALQLFYFAFLYDGADNPGRFDQYMWPVLRDDLEAGRLMLEEAVELLDDLWVRLNEVRGWNMALGGQTADGEDATNELTYLCLDVTERLRLPAPNVSVRVFAGSPRRLWERAIETIGRGTGMPAIYNDDVIVPALVRIGARVEDAREYAFGGCTEIQIPGKSNLGGEDGDLNLAKCLELALNDGRDMRSGEQMGPRTGEAEGFGDFEALGRAYERQVRAATAKMVAVSNLGQTVRSRYGAKIFRSLLIDDCLPRGLDPDAGGAVYGHGEVMTLGIAVTADSLTAMKRLVFDERAFTMAEVVGALRADFEGREALRQTMLRQPKYGQGDAEADAMAARVANHFWEMLQRFHTRRGGRYGGGVIVLGRNVEFGKQLAATPDGRRAGQPVEDSVGPMAGRGVKGPTAALTAAAGIDQTLGPMGVLCNVSLVPQCFSDAEGRDKVFALVQTYFRLGGQQVQITVADAEMLRAAQKEPERYADLMVRIGGYSDYFVRLSPELQADIISRIAYQV
jgi:formate C-acetyltransferase